MNKVTKTKMERGGRRMHQEVDSMRVRGAGGRLLHLLVPTVEAGAFVAMEAVVLILRLAM